MSYAANRTKKLERRPLTERVSTRSAQQVNHVRARQQWRVEARNLYVSLSLGGDDT